MVENELPEVLQESALPRGDWQGGVTIEADGGVEEEILEPRVSDSTPEYRSAAYPLEPRSVDCTHVGLNGSSASDVEHSPAASSAGVLRELSSLVRELAKVETRQEVADLVVDTATNTFGIELAVMYLRTEENYLTPVAFAGVETPPVIAPDDGDLWQSFVESRPQTVENAHFGPVSGDSIHSSPLGEHGLLVSSSSDVAELGALTDLLATETRVTLERLDHELALERCETELERREEALASSGELNAILRSINRAIVEADTPEAVKQAVCQRLVDSGLVTFAWFGEPDDSEDALVPRAWAGDDRGYLDQFDFWSGESEEPSCHTVRTGETSVVQNAGTDFRDHPWRQRALSRGFLSVVSIPMGYEGFDFGFLSLYAEDVSAFDDSTLSTLEELVATTAHAISGLHAKETLLTDSVTEIDLRIPASNAPLLRMARAVEGDLTVEETVRQSDGRTLLYVTVRNATRDIDVIETVSAVERVSLVSDGEGESLVEVHVSGPTVPTSLTDHGGAVHELDVDDSKIHARLGLTHDVDVREFVETLEQTYPGTELLARRRCERSVETQSDFSGRVEEALTDRQLEALHTAYLAGYFAWPRESSGQEVATSLGIAQSTFTRHLRVSEQKLLSLLFD